MSIKNIYALYFSPDTYRTYGLLVLSVILLLLRPPSCLAAKDSLEKKFDYLRIGFDLSKLVSSQVMDHYNAYEACAELHYKKDIFWVAEAGFGNSVINNRFLSLRTSNQFVRIGIDKTFFGREFRGDMDNAFIGLRYGAGFVSRKEATYFVQDTIWGNSNGTIPRSFFTAHWLELGAGFRLEIFKNIFMGWNVRARTFINPHRFDELPPPYIAGYGAGDKNTAFGYNFFLLYGFGKRK